MNKLARAEQRFAYLAILPAVLLIGGLLLYPIGYAIFVSFNLIEAAPLAFSVLSAFISLAYMSVQLNLFVLAYPRFVSETV